MLAESVFEEKSEASYGPEWINQIAGRTTTSMQNTISGNLVSVSFQIKCCYQAHKVQLGDISNTALPKANLPIWFKLLETSLLRILHHAISTC